MLGRRCHLPSSRTTRGAAAGAILVAFSLFAAGCTGGSTAGAIGPGNSSAAADNPSVSAMSDPVSGPAPSDAVGGSGGASSGPATVGPGASAATAPSAPAAPSTPPAPSTPAVTSSPEGSSSAPAPSSPTDSSPSPASSPPASSSTPNPSSSAAQLPGGGHKLFPGHLLVALYGQPGISGLGALGQQDTSASIERVKELAAKYAPLTTSPVLPTFEIIVTVASSGAGDDGNYSDESTIADLKPTVDAATAAGLYVVLDLQPGRTDFLTQAREYAELLRRPNVGLALDPEWRLKPGQRHLQQIGSVAASEINDTSAWLADLTAKAGLPQKLLLIHQFTLSMIRQESTLDVSHPELATVIQMDGQGTPETKQSTWNAITDVAPDGIRFGWKNFFEKDTPMVSPTDTMSKKPTPVLVSYE